MVLHLCDLDSSQIVEEFARYRPIDSMCYHWKSQRVQINDFATFEMLPVSYSRDKRAV